MDESTTPHLLHRAKELLHLARGVGATHTTLVLTRTHRCHATTEAGITEIATSTLRNASFHFEVGSTHVACQTNTLSDEAVVSFLQRSIRAAVDAQPDAPDDTSHTARRWWSVHPPALDILDTSSPFPSPDYSADQTARWAEDPALHLQAVEYTEMMQARAIVGDNQEDATDSSSRIDWQFAQGIAGRQSLLRFSARHRADLPADAMVATLLETRGAAITADSHQSATRAGVLLVSPCAAGPLLAALLRLPIMDALPACLSVVADTSLPRGLGTGPHAVAGTASHRQVLWEGGRQRAVLHRETARLPPNVTMALGNRSLARMEGEAERGVVIDGWTGGTIDPQTGWVDLSFVGAALQSGRRAGPIAGMALRLPIDVLFQKLKAVGNDPWPWDEVRCPTLAFLDVECSLSS